MCCSKGAAGVEAGVSVAGKDHAATHWHALHAIPRPARSPLCPLPPWDRAPTHPTYLHFAAHGDAPPALDALVEVKREGGGAMVVARCSVVHHLGVPLVAERAQLGQGVLDVVPRHQVLRDAMVGGGGGGGAGGGGGLRGSEEGRGAVKRVARSPPHSTNSPATRSARWRRSSCSPRGGWPGGQCGARAASGQSVAGQAGGRPGRGTAMCVRRMSSRQRTLSSDSTPWMFSCSRPIGRSDARHHRGLSVSGVKAAEGARWQPSNTPPTHPSAPTRTHPHPP